MFLFVPELSPAILMPDFSATTLRSKIPDSRFLNPEIPNTGALMMILRSSPPSPFGRKVRIAVSLLGFDGEVKIEAADPTDSNDSVRQQNPLGCCP